MWIYVEYVEYVDNVDFEDNTGKYRHWDKVQ